MNARPLALPSAALLLLVTSGCDPCPPQGTGTLQLNVTGLPAGVAGQVTALAAGATAGGSSLVPGANSLGGGEYVLTPATVAGPAHAIVRTAYSGAMETVCVASGQTATVTVAYSPVATSGKLWTANGNNGEPVVGFDAALLTATGNTAATVNARTRDTPTLAFDRDGNVWTIGGTTVDPTLNRYAAGSLASAARLAEIQIDVRGTGCLPAARAMAFDSADNLWVAMGCEDRVVRISAEHLRQSGTVTPTQVLTGVEFPSALAFDAAGNLWVAADGPNGTLHQYSAAQLGGGATAPAQSISIIATGSATAGSVEHLAFDASGNLWATIEANYNFGKLTAAQLTGAGARSLAPVNHVSIGVTALPQGPAFDETGRLWFGTGGTVGRLSAAQMATNSTYAAPVTPEVVVTSGSLGSAQDVAFYPAPAGLPLRHRLP
jgi:hypothetical protein